MSQTQDFRAPGFRPVLDDLRVVANAAAKALDHFATKIRAYRQETAEHALGYRRARIGSLKACEIPAVHRLNEEVGAGKKLTVAEVVELDRALQCKSPGRPGKTGPQSLTELMNDFRLWLEAPLATPYDRRGNLNAYPGFDAILAQAYASELARLQIAEGGKRRRRGSVSRYLEARRSVAYLFGVTPTWIKNLKPLPSTEAVDPHMFAEMKAWIDSGDP